MSYQSHPNQANRTNRIDRMLRMVDPGGTDQNALRARTSIHRQVDAHPPEVRVSGLLRRRPLVAAALAGALALLGAATLQGELTTAAPTKATVSQLEMRPAASFVARKLPAGTTDHAPAFEDSVWSGNTVSPGEQAPSL